MLFINSLFFYYILLYLYGMEKSNSPIEVTVGTLIKTLAKDKGVTLYKVASDAGFAPASIYTVLKRSNMSTKNLLRMLNALDAQLCVELKGTKFKLINKV